MVVSPRVLHERRLALLSPPALSHKAMLAMLALVDESSLEWPADEQSLSLEGAAAAFASLEGAPSSRSVLIEPAQHAKWLKRSKKLKASGGKGGKGGASVSGSVSSAAAAAAVRIRTHTHPRTRTRTHAHTHMHTYRPCAGFIIMVIFC